MTREQDVITTEWHIVRLDCVVMIIFIIVISTMARNDQAVSRRWRLENEIYRAHKPQLVPSE
jgi:hypothetical protein